MYWQSISPGNRRSNIVVPELSSDRTDRFLGVTLFNVCQESNSSGSLELGFVHNEPHLANRPWNKSLNFIFPTKYVIPKSLKFSHWPSRELLKTVLSQCVKGREISVGFIKSSKAGYTHGTVCPHAWPCRFDGKHAAFTQQRKAYCMLHASSQQMSICSQHSPTWSSAARAIAAQAPTLSWLKQTTYVDCYLIPRDRQWS